MTMLVSEAEKLNDIIYQRLKQHDHFFQRCIDMIPSELYKHTDSLTGYQDSDNEDREQEANSKYYKHRKQPLTADERKIKSQENKKRKYSSENASLSKNAEEDDDEPEQETVQAQKKQKVDAPQSSGSGDKMEDLKKRLQDRILFLKGQRESKKPHKQNKPAEKKEQNKKDQKKPVNKSIANKSASKDPSADINNTVESLRNELLSNSQNYSDDDEDYPRRTDTSGFEFNQITQLNTADSDDEKNYHIGIPKPGGSKKQRLQKLLQEAEKKRQRYQQLASSDNPLDNQKLQSEQWNDVLASAAGKKTILVNSEGGDKMISKSEIKIKKALKKMEKKKEKSSKEWSERLDQLDQEKQDKLKKREDNINKFKKHINVESAEDKPNANNGAGKVKINRPGQQNQNHHHHNNNHSNSNDKGKKQNRAGFEGKKSDGKFLNSK